MRKLWIDLRSSPLVCSHTASLLLHGKLIAGQANDSVPTPYDRERINAGIETLRKAFAIKVDLPVLAHRPAKEIVRHTL